MYAALLLATPALALPSFFSSQQAPIHAEEHSQGYKFDPLLHLPGTSPYFDAVGFGLKHKAPLGCNVTAASYIVRHGAIYAVSLHRQTAYHTLLTWTERRRIRRIHQALPLQTRKAPPRLVRTPLLFHKMAVSHPRRQARRAHTLWRA
jgi:hypothetical protein